MAGRVQATWSCDDSPAQSQPQQAQPRSRRHDCDSNRGFTNMEAHHSHHSHSRASPTEAASCFCNAFSAKESPSSILKHYSSAHVDDIIAYEHGLPQLAPFLGRSFSGLDGVRSHFDVVGECVTYSDMRSSNFVVDTSTSQVSVRGEAKFAWRSTGQNWDEVFTFMLAFDEHLKVWRYEIWADSGAAYLARKGLLG